MKKRILPALLALCMVMSLLPTMVFASEGGGGGGGGGSDPETPAPVVSKEVTQMSCTNAEAEATAAGKTVTGTKMHDECTATGCKCVTKTVTTTVTPAEEEGDDATTTVETTYVYGATLCEACANSKECNPCTVEGCEKAATHKDNHGGIGCTKDSRCPAKTHAADCEKACLCTVEHGENSAKCLKTVGTKTNKDGAKLCDTCANSAKHNPCSKKDAGCTLPYDHTGRHNTTECTQDAKCAASSGHNASCPKSCGNTENRGTEENTKTGVDSCTLTYGHAGNHNNEACKKVDRCGATAAGHDADCPSFNKCEVANCKLSAGHEDEHEAADGKTLTCLGAAGDKRCGATAHVTGCPKKCECATAHTSVDGWDETKCTGQPDCPECAKLTGEDACDCAACASTAGKPASGAVTDNEGNEVDTTDPKEPTVPEVPVKAEDFTDIDAEDASQEWLVDAVQTMLDNGWMQGVGGSKFDAGTEANTGMVLTVVARMYGEEGIEGANYAELAKAWADDNDLTEGIDLESDTIARKDIILLLWRLAGKSDSTQELEFTDIEGVEGDYLTALKWAVEKGIVMGNGDGTVTPDGVLTRGQLAALVARYADNVK